MVLNGLISASWFNGQLAINPVMKLTNPATGALINEYRLVGYDLFDELLNLFDLSTINATPVTGDLYDLGVIDNHDDLAINLYVVVNRKENGWDGMRTLTKIESELESDEYFELAIIKRIKENVK